MPNLVEAVKSYVAPATIKVQSPDASLIVETGKSYPLSPVSDTTAKAVYDSTSSGIIGQGTVTGVTAGNPTWGIVDYQGKPYATNVSSNGVPMAYAIEAGTVKGGVTQTSSVFGGLALWVVVAIVIVGIVVVVYFFKRKK